MYNYWTGIDRLEEHLKNIDKFLKLLLIETKKTNAELEKINSDTSFFRVITEEKKENG